MTIDIQKNISILEDFVPSSPRITELFNATKKWFNGELPLNSLEQIEERHGKQWTWLEQAFQCCRFRDAKAILKSIAIEMACQDECKAAQATDARVFYFDFAAAKERHYQNLVKKYL